ncbi:hypothetical protein GUJ93_ZPchr0006g45801 [Zizania palustris]|uniref:Uncharacterized protein n=1 Tax=Zizania palustris TaxID=103762 RepID=A0A8J5SMB4_ZIZPA|nr:hypothetical protein GUJ93_ZPchr0006g45801 [Zizania palustris]
MGGIGEDVAGESIAIQGEENEIAPPIVVIGQRIKDNGHKGPDVLHVGGLGMEIGDDGGFEGSGVVCWWVVVILLGWIGPSTGFFSLKGKIGGGAPLLLEGGGGCAHAFCGGSSGLGSSVSFGGKGPALLFFSSCVLLLLGSECVVVRGRRLRRHGHDEKR